MIDFVWDSTPWVEEFRTEDKCIEEMTSVYEIYKLDTDMVFYKEAVLEKDYSWAAIHYWCNKHKKSQALSKVINKLKDLHETRIIKRWLLKTHSEGITKMVLQNVHNWEDKKVMENMNKEVPLTKEELDDLNSVLDDNDQESKD